MSETYLCDANASAERRKYAEKFGQRLVGLMDAADMTVAEMHRLTGLAENTISRYRTGQTEPTLYVIFQIARLLGCSADELLEMDESEPRYRAYSGPGVEVRVAKEGRSPSTIFLAGNRAVAVYGKAIGLEGGEWNS